MPGEGIFARGLIGSEIKVDDEIEISAKYQQNIFCFDFLPKR